MGKKFPCGVCNRSVKCNQKGLLCITCHKWIHLTCTNVPVDLYDDRTEKFINWECARCVMRYLPFHNISINSSDEGYVNESIRSDLKDCKELTFKQLSNMKGIKFIQLNVVSLLKNLDEIKLILYNNDIHICMLNETRLDTSIDNHEIDIPGYSVVRKDRDRKGGGVAIYVHESLNYKQIEYSSLDNLEAVLISVNLKNAKPLLVLNWYRPPNSKSDVLDSYDNTLSFLEAFHCNVIVMGDINIDISKNLLTGEKKKYYEINNIHGMHQINMNECTRITNDTSTLLDHMVTDCLDKVNSSGVIHNGLSDHSMSYLVWKTHKNLPDSHAKYVTFRKSKGIDIQSFIAELELQTWTDIKSYESIDQALLKFEELLMTVVNQYMPLKTKRVRKKHSPWLNEFIYKLIKERDKMKEKAKFNDSEIFWKEYKRLKNKVTLEIRKSKKKYYSEQLGQCRDRNQSWKILKSVIPSSSSSSAFSHDPDENAKLSHEFNAHFANVATNVRKKNGLHDIPIENSNESLPFHVRHQFEFSLVCEDEVLKHLYSLKNTKSVGIDNISSFILKTSAPVIVKSLTYLINKSLLEGIFPNRWKTAKIIPVFKKGDKMQPDNYRPISLLSCASKVLEKVVQKQLLNYLRINGILSVEQSGFRLKHSTCTALIKVTDEWLRALDKGEYTGSVFVDLQKAFDVVDHDILLKKLADIGIGDVSLKWFRSYLSDRKIITSINNVLSDELPLKYGVPQGSLLGPLLFLIFINDLPECFDKCTVHLYADDTVIYYADKDVHKIEAVLNKELKSLDIWMRRNKLKVNCSKTVSMLFGTKHMLAKCNSLNLRFSGETLSQVKNFKYLGVHVDDELKWNLHIEQLCKKVGKMINYLARLKHFLNTVALKTIYNVAILPHFDYADIVWQSASKTSLDHLQKLQNRAARIILNVNPYEHKPTCELHDLLDIEMLDRRRMKHMLSFVYKILHDMTPDYMQEYFVFKTTPYDLRRSEVLALPKPRTNNNKRTFSYRGSTAYNDIPLVIRDAVSLSDFNRQISEL